MTTQINIKNDSGQNIVGILEKKSSNGTLGEKLVIICHGSAGHKNYLFQEKLAKELSFDNFRFDFRGNGESDGILKFSNFQEDVEDIDTVVKYLEKEFGYKLYAAIGHSKGSVAILKYACYVNRNISHVINISARYNMAAGLSLVENSAFDSLKEQGYFYQNNKIRGEIIRMKVTKEDLHDFINYDMSFVHKMPDTTSVLTCHGIMDEIVSVKDATIFANLIPNHTLKLLPGVNHNYIYQDIFLSMAFIFRSGNLLSITDDGITTLRKLNVQKIFDLRSNPEVNKLGIKNIEGMTRVHAPVFNEDDYRPEALFERWKLYTRGTEGYSQAYMVILEEGKRAYYKIFKHILEYPTQPFVVHCTAGKDRTGIFAMLLLKLLGVNDDIISREYELTHVNSRVTDPKEIKLYIKLTNNYFDEEEIKETLSARYEFMTTSLQKFQNHYKSVDNYLFQCGFTKKEIEAIKYNLVMSNNIKNSKLNQNDNVIRSLL
ncbi:tyrosine phosphatase family-domain-containing protein [Rhizophagus irregularis DAOM 181602=DAOM 197198]|nr:tyrosine phosphatase family-domain-containing protein [Rhizophagus irregularis DAOM 181602=DAOM 197198]CAB4401571.1 unnamed protein product [Rhizophagus irregularis]CAB5377044.1 unnamed protein product [Rhizophagus irregularis]